MRQNAEDRILAIREQIGTTGSSSEAIARIQCQQIAGKPVDWNRFKALAIAPNTPDTIDPATNYLVMLCARLVRAGLKLSQKRLAFAAELAIKGELLQSVEGFLEDLNKGSDLERLANIKALNEYSRGTHGRKGIKRNEIYSMKEAIAILKVYPDAQRKLQESTANDPKAVSA